MAVPAKKSGRGGGGGGGVAIPSPHHLATHDACFFAFPTHIRISKSKQFIVVLLAFFLCSLLLLGVFVVVAAAAIEANISDFSMSFESYWNINYIAQRTHAKRRTPLATRTTQPPSHPATTSHTFRKTPRKTQPHKSDTLFGERAGLCGCVCVCVRASVCLAIKLNFFSAPLLMFVFFFGFPLETPNSTLARFLFHVTRANRICAHFLFICRTHTANVYLNLLYRMRNRIFHPLPMLHNKFNGFLDKSGHAIHKIKIKME